MTKKDWQRHMAYEALVILGVLALLLFVCRLWADPAAGDAGNPCCHAAAAVSQQSPGTAFRAHAARGA